MQHHPSNCHSFTLNSGNLKDILNIGEFCHNIGLSCHHENISKYDDKRTKSGRGFYTFFVITNDKDKLDRIREYIKAFHETAAE